MGRLVAIFYVLIFRLHRKAIDARRRDRTVRFYSWSIIAGACAGFLLGGALMAVTVLFAVGLWWMAIPVGLYLMGPMLEPALARHVLAPLGWAQVAYWAARADSTKDPEAYALCSAARACARNRSGDAEAFVIARRNRRKPLGDAEVVATAFLAAGRGDAETARALLRSTHELVEVHPRVRELAGEWLAVDAATRGAWAELHADAIATRWPASPLTFFLEGVAARKLGVAGAPGSLEMTARWLLAPHRRATRALRAIAYVPPPVRPTPSAALTDEPAAPDAPPEAPPARAPLPRAVTAHLALSQTAPTPTGLAATASAWDQALSDPDVRAWLARRALELDAPLGAVDRALREVATAVTDDLARAADASGLGAPSSRGIVGDALAHKLRHGRLDALEGAYTRWADRRSNGQVLPAIDEWREWVALRAAYDEAVAAGGVDLRRLAFPHAYRCANRMAVWLWNTRDEYALAHAMHRWLLREALAVGDVEAIELCTRNARLAVNTRMGRIEPELAT